MHNAERTAPRTQSSGRRRVIPRIAPATAVGRKRLSSGRRSSYCTPSTYAATAQSVPRIAPVRASRAIARGSFNPLRLLYLLLFCGLSRRNPLSGRLERVLDVHGLLTENLLGGRDCSGCHLHGSGFYLRVGG